MHLDIEYPMFPWLSTFKRCANLSVIQDSVHKYTRQNTDCINHLLNTVTTQSPIDTVTVYSLLTTASSTLTVQIINFEVIMLLAFNNGDYMLSLTTVTSHCVVTVPGR